MDTHCPPLTILMTANFGEKSLCSSTTPLWKSLSDPWSWSDKHMKATKAACSLWNSTQYFLSMLV